MKTIAIFTDSLGLPRPEVPLTRSWPSVLARKITGQAIVRTFSFGGGTSSKMLKEVSGGYLCNIDTDIVIYQLGIVDCAPRALRRHELLVCKAPGISRIVRPMIQRNYAALTRRRKIAYTSKEKYTSNLTALHEAFPESQKFLVPILPACRGYEIKSPLIAERIRVYNEIGVRVFSDDIIDLVCPPEDLNGLFLQDHHHLSETGAEFLAASVATFLTTRSCI